MKLEHEDPRVIDYVLGELPEDERAAIRAALAEAENAEAAAFAREISGFKKVAGAILQVEADRNGATSGTSASIRETRPTSRRPERSQPPFSRGFVVVMGCVLLVLASMSFSTLSHTPSRRVLTGMNHMDTNDEGKVAGGIVLKESRGDSSSGDLDDLAASTITRGADIGGAVVAPAPATAAAPSSSPTQPAPPAILTEPVSAASAAEAPAKPSTLTGVEVGGGLRIREDWIGDMLENRDRSTSGSDAALYQVYNEPDYPSTDLKAFADEDSDDNGSNGGTVAGASPTPSPTSPESPTVDIPVFITIETTCLKIPPLYHSEVEEYAPAESPEVSRMIKESMAKQKAQITLAENEASPRDGVVGGQEASSDLVIPNKPSEAKAEAPSLQRQMESLGYQIEPQREDRYQPQSTLQIALNLPVQFKSVLAEPLSTFAADVDTASYTLIRRDLQGGHLPAPQRVRTEEFINYFDYAYPEPTGEHPFSVTVDVAACPWAPTHRLARVGIKGKALDARERVAANLVFLVDVSGSMDSPDKLPLVRESLRGLLETLKESDRVALVTYAGESRVLLEPTSCEQKDKIRAAIDSLGAGGSTNGAGGITAAYEQARRAFIKKGINRVLIATDGDFNVGVTSQQELERLITQQAKSGVFLSVLGYGTGNLNDTTLETLADKGNGFYAYIDDIGEARRVLVEKGLSAIATIAKDVKFQIEFNPAKVGHYRQIGYENRQLAAQDFNDDTKDAGDIGPGHTVTALYELVPSGQSPTPGVDPLKYQQTEPAPVANNNPESMTVKLRYKQPDAQTSQLLEVPVLDSGTTFDAAPQDFQFASAVAAFAQVLKGLQLAQPPTLEQIRTIADATKGNDPARQEFVDLVVTTKTLVR